MALNKNTNTTPSFEAPDGENVGVETTVDVKAQAQARLAAAAAAHAATKPAEEAKSPGTAVAVPAGSQVARSAPMVNPLELLKDAFRVEWDTLRNLVITNGNVMDKQTGKALGDSIALEILSFQDQWVVSPGVDGDEAKEHVRYSDDGVTTTQGEDVKAHLQALKDAGFDQAKISERLVIAGALVDLGDKGRKTLPELQDTLVQLSLAPTSKGSFKRYQMDQAFKIGKSMIAPEGAQVVRINCNVQTKGTMSWTVADFSRYEAA
jgi:hypothetical protein